MARNETAYLAWLASRRAVSEKRLAAMLPITPVETPLLALIRKQAATNG